MLAVQNSPHVAITRAEARDFNDALYDFNNTGDRLDLHRQHMVPMSYAETPRSRGRDAVLALDRPEVLPNRIVENNSNTVIMPNFLERVTSDFFNVEMRWEEDFYSPQRHRQHYPGATPIYNYWINLCVQNDFYHPSLSEAEREFVHQIRNILYGNPL